jgi:hypothetical protein
MKYKPGWERGCDKDHHMTQTYLDIGSMTMFGKRRGWKTAMISWLGCFSHLSFLPSSLPPALSPLTQSLGEHSTTWAMPLALFASVIFQMGSHTFWLGQPETMILLPIPPSTWDYRCETLWSTGQF